jgi:DNA-binding MarR family transcriptional regulator
MAPKSPYEISLSSEERRVLETYARRQKLSYRLVVRARIILLAAEGFSNEEIARRLGISRPTVVKWRRRFAGRELGFGQPSIVFPRLLRDGPRPGRGRKSVNG